MPVSIRQARIFGMDYKGITLWSVHRSGSTLLEHICYYSMLSRIDSSKLMLREDFDAPHQVRDNQWRYQEFKYFDGDSPLEKVPFLKALQWQKMNHDIDCGAIWPIMRLHTTFINLNKDAISVQHLLEYLDRSDLYNIMLVRIDVANHFASWMLKVLTNTSIVYDANPAFRLTYTQKLEELRRSPAPITKWTLLQCFNALVQHAQQYVFAKHRMQRVVTYDQLTQGDFDFMDVTAEEIKCLLGTDRLPSKMNTSAIDTLRECCSNWDEVWTTIEQAKLACDFCYADL